MKNISLDKTTDYFISPVRNRQGSFYDTRKHNNTLPDCADANDAYNIALKGLWAIDKVRSSAFTAHFRERLMMNIARTFMA